MPKKQNRGQVILLHWNADECLELSGPLRKGGWDVQEISSTDNLKLKDLRANPPTAVVISLRRLPSHGREVADALWYTKWGRAIPLVFFDGEPEKVEPTRAKFPAATFVGYDDLLQSLENLPPQASAGTGKR